MNYIEAVRMFHNTMEHPINKIGEESLEIRQLRIKLLFEELKELAEASDCNATFGELCENFYHSIPKEGDFIDGDNVNYTEELDALCDLMYVLCGKILTGGYKDIFNEAFALVQASNMSKACYTEEEAIETCRHYKEQGIECNYIKKDSYYVVKRSDDKVLKSINYNKVNLEDLVEHEFNKRKT